MRAWTVLGALVIAIGLPAAASASPERVPLGAGTQQFVQLPWDIDAAGALDDAASEARLVGLLSFRPAATADVAERFARAQQRRDGGSLGGYERFFRARWHDFESMLARYDMQPNDVTTARAFAIVVGYKAYNGDRLSDPTSAGIFRTMLAVQTAARQVDRPWSNAQKQALYSTLGLQASVLNWQDDDAHRRGDTARIATVRARARAMLQEQLGRSPDRVKLDDFACAVYPSADCGSLIRRLRADFATAAQSQ